MLKTEKFYIQLVSGMNKAYALKCWLRLATHPVQHLTSPVVVWDASKEDRNKQPLFTTPILFLQTSYEQPTTEIKYLFTYTQISILMFIEKNKS